MKSNPRTKGDEHVKLVYQALQKKLKEEILNEYPLTVIKTVEYITKLFPSIKEVNSKFEIKNGDKVNDLTLYLKEGEKVSLNLFILRKGRKIQPKNPGAKSFFSKYFLSKELQDEFNEYYEGEYLKFLKNIVSLKEGEHYINDKKELKKNVKKHFPRIFTDEINTFRDMFLYQLREKCFQLLSKTYNNTNIDFTNAYKELLMLEDVNIITTYSKDENDIGVQQFSAVSPILDEVKIYKSGRRSVGIKFGELALTMRFKFESGPLSSVKLATGYDDFKNESEKAKINNTTTKKMQNLFRKHNYIISPNSSNAIGKCHEALTYYYFLKEFPNISQIEKDDCVNLMEKYYSLVKPDILEMLYNSTSTVVPVLKEKLEEKYKTFTLDSIELIPENYIKDRLDTGDIQLILSVNNSCIIENISLKAINRSNSNITTKNPGIGTILGETYFNIGSMGNIINEVKERFQVGEINHKECLEILSMKLGEELENAPQGKLRTGIQNLLGKSIMAVTFYSENCSVCVEHSNIDSKIKVLRNQPSLIQNTLTWNENLEKLSLRVKFSRGQAHGWSSIKLASEYKIN